MTADNTLDPERKPDMNETLYAIRLESGGGSLNREILGTADTLEDAREGAVSFRESVLPDSELTVWRMERVGDDDDPPMTDHEAELAAAWRAGWNARNQDVPITDNPHGKNMR